MAKDGATQVNLWPLQKFCFIVKFGSQDNTASFQEISGLDFETKAIEYRHGNSSPFSPGIVKTGNLRLKKGVFVKENNFFKWFDAIKINTIKRETVTIQLLDEGGKPTITWTLFDTWPTKVSSPDLKSDANEVAVESLELTYESISIASA